MKTIALQMKGIIPEMKAFALGLKNYVRFSRFAVVAAFLVLAAFAGRADELSDDSRYSRLIEWADQAVGKEQWGRAIDCLREAMSIDPANPLNVMLLSNIGMFQFYAGDDSLALNTLTQARSIAPASVVILNNRAKVLTAMNRLDDALADYYLITGLDSVYAPAFLERASLLIELGRFDKAEHQLEKYRELEPNESQGKLLQAILFAATDRQAEAAALYGELLAEREDAVYYSARAMCRIIDGDWHGASEDIGRGLELDPENGELYFCRAYLNHLRFDDAARDADAARALSHGVAGQRVAALPSLSR